MEEKMIDDDDLRKGYEDPMNVELMLQVASLRKKLEKLSDKDLINSMKSIPTNYMFTPKLTFDADEVAKCLMRGTPIPSEVRESLENHYLLVNTTLSVEP